MTLPILIIDGHSCVGRGVVATALAAGRTVIATGPDSAALQSLQALQAGHAPGALTLLAGDTGDDARAEALAADVRRLRRPLGGIVFAACREPVGGRLLETGSDALQRALEAVLRPHFATARAFLPLLAETDRNGSYVVVAGPGGEQPWAGYGQHSVAVAAERMLLRVLHDEARALAVRVHLLAVEMPARTEQNRERACTQWPSTQAIGERALALLEQRDGTRADEAIVRYAWHAAPALPVAPAEPATPVALATPGKNAGRASDRRTRAAANVPLPQRRALDDAWAALQPLLSDNQKNKETAP